jgi:toxin ParE1/3/4
VSRQSSSSLQPPLNHSIARRRSTSEKPSAATRPSEAWFRVIVVISDAAEVELEAIGDWIAEANPTRALSFVMELRRRCEALSDVPRGFPLVPRYQHLGIRRRPYGDYLIFYRILNDTVEILYVLHGACDYEPILFPNE